MRKSLKQFYYAGIMAIVVLPGYSGNRIEKLEIVNKYGPLCFNGKFVQNRRELLIFNTQLLFDFGRFSRGLYSKYININTDYGFNGPEEYHSWSYSAVAYDAANVYSRLTEKKIKLKKSDIKGMDINGFLFVENPQGNLRLPIADIRALGVWSRQKITPTRLYQNSDGVVEEVVDNTKKAIIADKIDWKVFSAQMADIGKIAVWTDIKDGNEIPRAISEDIPAGWVPVLTGLYWRIKGYGCSPSNFLLEGEDVGFSEEKFFSILWYSEEEYKVYVNIYSANSITGEIQKLADRIQIIDKKNHGYNLYLSPTREITTEEFGN